MYTRTRTVAHKETDMHADIRRRTNAEEEIIRASQQQWQRQRCVKTTTTQADGRVNNEPSLCA